MSSKKVIAIVVAGVLLLAALLASIVFLWGVYNKHWEGPFVTRVADVFPIPAAKVGTRTVLLRDYFSSLTSLRIYLASEEATSQNQRRPVIDDDRKSALER